MFPTLTKTPLFSLFVLLMIGFAACRMDKPTEKARTPNDEKQIWVFKHKDQDDHSFTVFSNELPVNKYFLPDNFLAIRDHRFHNWNCLLKWEGDVLWFYTPSESYFASNNSNNGRTQWTIVRQELFDSLFYKTEPEEYIRFSSKCDELQTLCLQSEELQIGGLKMME